MAFTYKYERPALAVDCVVFGLDDRDLKIMLIQRDLEPFKGRWALPGGFVRTDENLEDTARRELREETGLSDVFLEQLYTFGEVKRDPRERVVSVAYYSLVNLEGRAVKAATDAREAGWFRVSEVAGKSPGTPALAFDHREIVRAALDRLRGKLRYQPIGFELLPEKFTLSQLQRLYETVLERPLDKRNFRKKILKIAAETGLLVALDEFQQDVAHRAARLYRFDEHRYDKARRGGFLFEV